MVDCKKTPDKKRHVIVHFDLRLVFCHMTFRKKVKSTVGSLSNSNYHGESKNSWDCGTIRVMESENSLICLKRDQKYYST